MTSQFNSDSNSSQFPIKKTEFACGSPLSEESAEDGLDPSKNPDSLFWQDDRFELLSAYLDGEVSPDERRQVEEWLASDPQMRQLYARMQTLCQGSPILPVPPTERSPEQMADGVFVRLDRQRRQRWAWGGGAMAALFLAVVSGMTLTNRSYAPNFAQYTSLEGEAQPSIALDRFGGEPPKASMASSETANSETSLVSRALFIE